MSKSSGVWLRRLSSLLWMARPPVSAWPSLPARHVHPLSRAQSRQPSSLAMAPENETRRRDEADDDAERCAVLGRSVPSAGYNVLGTDLLVDRARGAGPPPRRRRPAVVVRVTADFLRYARANGRDGAAVPAAARAGDLLRLAPDRWVAAYNAGRAPRLFLQATDAGALEHVPLEVLRLFAIDAADAAAILRRLDRQRSRLDGLWTSEDCGVRGGEEASFQ